MDFRGGRSRYLLSYVQCTRCDWDGWRKRRANNGELVKPCPAKRRNGSVCGAPVGLA